MSEGLLPADVRVAVLEVVVMVLPAGFRQVVRKLAVGEGIRGEAEIRAGLVQRHRVEGGQHAEIRKDRGVVLPVAVAVGGDVHNQADMEAGFPGTDSGGIFRHLPPEHVGGGAVGCVDGVKGAGADAPAAALAEILMDDGFPALVGDGVGTAFPGA